METKQLRQFLPLVTAGLAVACIYLYFRKKRFNTKKDPDKKKVKHAFYVEDLKEGKKLSLCRCWMSETFPLCDGAHKKYNKLHGDNLGPVDIKWRSAKGKERKKRTKSGGDSKEASPARQLLEGGDAQCCDDCDNCTEKPRGRMSAYTFFVQDCREEQKKKHPDENVVFAEFAKKCAERWQKMSDEEKKRFHEMAEKDKKRYKEEMGNYKPKNCANDMSTEDTNPPQRALSAFFWFSNDERAKVEAKMPDGTSMEITKELARRWNECPQDVRNKYEALAAEDKTRYEKELEAYKSMKEESEKKRSFPGLTETDKRDEDKKVSKKLVKEAK